MKVPIYHVGLLARGKTAVFQYRQTKDELNCEILSYQGKRQTTKKAAQARLRKLKFKVLEVLNAYYPGRFTNVEID